MVEGLSRAELGDEGNNGIRVLLLEDNPGDARLVEEELSELPDYHFHIHHEAKLGNALRSLEQNDFDVALVDLSLPDSFGLDTFTALRVASPQTPIVILSGSMDEISAIEAVRGGAQDYQLKAEANGRTLSHALIYAIERKRTENDLSALVRITSAALSGLSTDDLLQGILQTLVEVMRASSAAIFLRNEDGLILRSSFGLGGPREAFTQSMGKGIVGKIAQTKEPVHVSDAQADPEVPDFFREKGIRTILGVPIMDGQAVMGVLHVDWHKVHPKSQMDVSLLTVAAERLGASIARAIHHDELAESERLSSALNNINSDINSTLDYGSIMERAISRSTMALGAESAAIDLLEGDNWVRQYVHGLPSEFVGTRFPVSNAPYFSLLAREKRPIPLNRAEGDKRIDQIVVKEYGIRSVLAAPIVIKGVMIGAILFHHHTSPKQFTELQVDFSMKAAASIAHALENSRLYREEQRQRTLLQRIIESTPAGITLIDGNDMSVKWMNPIQEKFLSEVQGKKDATGKKVHDLIPDLEPNGLVNILRAVVSKREPSTNLEFPTSRYGEGVTYWNYSFVPVIFDSSVDVLVLGVDITEQVVARKKMEELANQADEERRRLRAILDTLPVGVIITDAEGRFIETNAIAKSIWGGRTPSAQNIVGFSEYKAWRADTGERFRGEDWGLAKAVQRGETSVGQVVDIERFDGTRGTILDSAAPVKDANGRPIGAVVVIQDITRQRRLEHEAIEAKERAELYLDLLTHDIGNLNAAAVGYLQLADDKLRLESGQRKYIQGPLEALNDVNRLIEIVRKLQQVESQGMNRTLVDLGFLLEDTKELYEDNPEKKVTINYRPQLKKMVYANELISDVFNNIVGNAIKHTEGAVTIDIEVGRIFEAGREYHKVVIADDGPGIPDDMKAKIFRRLYKGKTKASGRGIGLYLVKTLVEEFDGRVWVEDRVPGDHTQGAKFVVILPVASSRVA